MTVRATSLYDWLLHGHNSFCLSVCLFVERRGCEVVGGQNILKQILYCNCQGCVYVNRNFISILILLVMMFFSWDYSSITRVGGFVTKLFDVKRQINEACPRKS